MPISLLRVDERLIHGQVVVGWGVPLGLERLVVADDELAASPWEQELYALGVPEGVGARFATVADARAALPEWTADPRRTALLLRSVAAAARLAEDGSLSGRSLNLGGVHHAAGRDALLPYLHLTEGEVEALRVIAAAGCEVFAQDLPGARRVSLDELERARP